MLAYVDHADTLVMLLLMFASVAMSMYLTSGFIPQLTQDAHQKNNWIDGLRGVAAAVVALNHAPLVLMNLGIGSKAFLFGPDQIKLFQLFGSLGVQIFFCITGALFTSKLLFAAEVDWTSFFKRRFLRIVPGYVFAATLAIIIVLLLTQFNVLSFYEIFRALPNIYSFGFFELPNINGFHFVRLIGVIWSLAYEWRYYVMLPLLFVMIRNLPMLPVVATIVVFAACDAMLSASSFWVYFVSGAIAAPLLDTSPGKYTKWFGTFLIIASAVTYALVWYRFPNYGPHRWFLMTILFFSVAMSRPYLLTLRPFVAMGSASYSFYLLHVMVVFVVFYLFNKLIMDVTLLSFRSFVILACFSLAVAALVSALSYLKIERPFMRVVRI